MPKACPILAWKPPNPTYPNDNMLILRRRFTSMQLVPSLMAGISAIPASSVPLFGASCNGLAFRYHFMAYIRSCC